MKLFSKIIMFFLLFFSIQTMHANEPSKPSAKSILATPQERSLGCNEYCIKFENFPKNQSFDVFYKRLIQGNPNSYEKHEEIVINDDGLIQIDNKYYIYYGFNSYMFAPGEEIKYRFIKKNGDVIAEASFIPKPIEVKSKYGSFYIHVKLLSLNPALYSFQVQGVEENESLHLTSLSDPEILESDYIHGKNCVWMYTPDVVGRKGGKALIKISRSNGDIALFSLCWGLEITKEIFRNLDRFIDS